MELPGQRSTACRGSNPDLRFPVDKRHVWGLSSSVFHRWLARKTAAMLWFRGARYYQFGGYDGALKKNYVLVDAPVFQLMHWILTTAGYDCTMADVMERCGVDPSAKDAPEGTLNVERWNEAEEFARG